MTPKDKEEKPTSLTSQESNDEDVSHGDHPRDSHLKQVWFFEPRIQHGVLTLDGMTQIATHKYVSGSYTSLDTFLSPNLWEPLTNLLPMWLAPNLVTTCGGCFSLLSFLTCGHYLEAYYEDATAKPPTWLYFLNGTCMFVYYTFDCMDGKQARRTGSSSPLGQLFDHGMDCLCVLTCLRQIQCIVLFDPSFAVLVQLCLQVPFWQAQWEEYYTGILPHSSGDFGVTETNYFLALWSILTGVFGRDIYEHVVIAASTSEESTFPPMDLQVRHVMGMAWLCVVATLMMLSMGRVFAHVQKEKLPLKVFGFAMSKFLSPILLGVLAEPDGNLALGLCFCLITIKIIVYSMAKMAYATIQVDILPFAMVILAQRYYFVNAHNDTLYYALDVYYIGRLAFWIHAAIHQLCKRLDIPLFRIKPKKKES